MHVTMGEFVREPKAEALTPREHPSGRRLAALDFVRLSASLFVVSYHYLVLESAWGRATAEIFPHGRRVAAYGWLGVEIFFLVSGFVICMSAWGRTLGQFAVSRISRIFPAYWAGVAFTALVLFNWPEVRRIGKVSDVFVNLTMLQGGLRVPHIDDAYWTLFVELKFYVLFACVIRMGVTYRNCVAFCGLWTLAGIVAPTTGDGVLAFFAIPTCSPYFIAGIAFYLMRRFKPNMLLWGMVVLQFLLAQTHVQARMASNLGKEAGERLPAWPAHLVIALGFVLMAAIALGFLDRVQWRWLPHAGALTYPLYLVHMMAGLTIIHHFRDEMAPVPLAFAVIGFMLVLAWLIHRLIERPVSRLLRTGLTKAVEDMRAETPDSEPRTHPPLPSQRSSAAERESVPVGR